MQFEVRKHCHQNLELEELVLPLAKGQAHSEKEVHNVSLHDLDVCTIQFHHQPTELYTSGDPVAQLSDQQARWDHDQSSEHILHHPPARSNLGNVDHGLPSVFLVLFQLFCIRRSDFNKSSRDLSLLPNNNSAGDIPVVV